MTGRQDFWSRRKAAVDAEKRAHGQALEDGKVDEARQALEEKPEADVLAELNLPDPDTMQQGDDFSAFMAKAVPDRLRRRALRRLWLSNPVLANLDNLVDYGEDYTDAATVVENLQTVYQVGKGMIRQVEAPTETAASDPPSEAVEGGIAEPSSTVAETVAEDDTDAAEASPAPTEVREDDAEEEIAVEQRSKRQMRFAFVDAEDSPVEAAR